MSEYTSSGKFPVAFSSILNVIVSVSGTSNYEGAGFDAGTLPTNTTYYVWSRYGISSRVLGIGR